MIDSKRFNFPVRLRRNRQNEAIRSLVRETHLDPADFIVPLFLMEGENKRDPIPSMPGIERYSIDQAVEKAQALYAKGIQAVALFPKIKNSLRTDDAREAWNSEGLTTQAIRSIKAAVPSLCVIVDIALDPFTSHGHDGLVDRFGNIENDATIESLAKMALCQAQAGADLIAPSDMMDGRVGVLRKVLDDEGFEKVGILSYSIKYASSLYFPFREAIDTRLSFGDKKTYQMDPANSREALLEAQMDEQEGADILMIKPASLYLDIICKLRTQTHRPIAAYHVSGEYAMVMAAHQNGWLHAPTIFKETLLSIKRAGADMIITYAAEMVLDAASQNL